MAHLSPRSVKSGFSILNNLPRLGLSEIIQVKNFSYLRSNSASSTCRWKSDQKLPLIFSPNFGELSRRSSSSSIKMPEIDFDWSFYTNPSNWSLIEENLEARQGDVALVEKLTKLCAELGLSDRTSPELAAVIARLPNFSHPEVANLKEPAVIYQKDFVSPEFKIRGFEEISRIIGGGRYQNLGLFSGDRSYYLTGPLAWLEQALIQWTLAKLLEKGFSLVSVPDILNPDIIERCGMNVDGERTQVYRLDENHGGLALSGTAEMALGGYLMSKRLSELPVKLCSVSRCYRAETSDVQMEKGIYRVHNFTKVEMFIATEGTKEASEAALEEIHEIERQLFDELGLAYRVLDMSPDELGAPASRKYDIEAWMPGRLGGFWGEISSCSNCTDFQARRLNIRDVNNRFCHTVNGTACAVPRMIISICEQFQQGNGTVTVPETLRPYLAGQDVLAGKPRKQRPNLKFLPSANYFEKEESSRK